ncbi:MAG TPA: ABC transporter substrate-binding protein [Rhizomicrobium sp.]|nr:ABC transporter substrate-binding protein [Rhizomicrobium sp.]
MIKAWMRVVCLAAAVLAGVAGLSAPSRAEATDPAVKPVQQLCDALIDVMKNAKTLGMQGRYDKLKPVIEQTFDLADMTKYSVGPVWMTMSPQDHESLEAAIERYTLANYASNFDGYDGEKFVVDPTVQVRGSDRIVSTKLVTKTETHPLAYKMRQIGGNWRVLDVYYENSISQLAKQRSDFGATVQSGGAPALVKKLNALSDKLMKG